MNKEYLKGFLDANNELVTQSIENLKGFDGRAEDFETYLKAYSEISKQHLSAMKQLSDVEAAEEGFVIEYEKINVANENFVDQQKQALQTEVMNASKDMVMQIISMIFYTARFREGLRFDIDNYVNDGFVRGLVQKLPDFMKSRK